MNSQFELLGLEWKDIHEAASKAEGAAIPDPRTHVLLLRSAGFGIGRRVGVQVRPCVEDALPRQCLGSSR